MLIAPGSRHIEVIAHRGAHLDHPENTIEAIEAAIALGCDWIEIDVRRTRDGQYVLMHNAMIDSTTSGHGAVADLTAAEIRRAGPRVPALDEALAAMRGRAGVYLDAKAIDGPAILAALEQHRMLDRCVVYGSLTLLQDLVRLGHPELVMPEAVSKEALEKSLGELKPKVVAFDRRDFQDEVIAVARKAGVEIFVDRLGPDDTEASWEDAVQRGATGIQTDHPADCIQYLARRGNRVR